MWLVSLIKKKKKKIWLLLFFLFFFYVFFVNWKKNVEFLVILFFYVFFFWVLFIFVGLCFICLSFLFGCLLRISYCFEFSLFSCVFCFINEKTLQLRFKYFLHRCHINISLGVLTYIIKEKKRTLTHHWNGYEKVKHKERIYISFLFLSLKKINFIYSLNSFSFKNFWSTF